MRREWSSIELSVCNDIDGTLQLKQSINLKRKLSLFSQALCQGMFLRKQGELKEILLRHFAVEDKDGTIREDLGPAKDFELRYCKDYPKESNADKLMQGGNRTKNLADLLEFAAEEVNETEAEKKRKKQYAEMMDGGAAAALNVFRSQLKRGFKLVAEEVHRQRREGGKEVKRGTAQMEHCVELLVNNNVEKPVIQSVLHFAYDSGLFDDGTNKKAEEEEPNSKLMDELEIVPHWFQGYDDNEVNPADEGHNGKRKKFRLTARNPPWKKRLLHKRENTAQMEDLPFAIFDTDTGKSTELQHIEPREDSDDDDDIATKLAESSESFQHRQTDEEDFQSVLFRNFTRHFHGAPNSTQQMNVVESHQQNQSGSGMDEEFTFNPQDINCSEDVNRSEQHWKTDGDERMAAVDKEKGSSMWNKVSEGTNKGRSGPSHRLEFNKIIKKENGKNKVNSTFTKYGGSDSEKAKKRKQRREEKKEQDQVTSLLNHLLSIVVSNPASLDMNNFAESAVDGKSQKDGVVDYLECINDLLDDLRERRVCSKEQWKMIKKLTLDPQKSSLLVKEYKRLLKRKGGSNDKEIFQGLVEYAELYE